MRILVLAGVIGVTLIGCRASTDSDATMRAGHGRYLGVGAYPAGRLWSKLVVAEPAKAASAATTADDEHVIVVVDSRTGEVRECGDYSGLCVTLSPWTKAVAPQQTSPITLIKHLADLEQEQNRSVRESR